MTNNAFTPERIAQLRREVMENATPMTLRSALHTAFNFFPAALDEIERLQAENADFAEQLALRSETGMAKDMQEIMAQNNALSTSLTQAQARIAGLEIELAATRVAITHPHGEVGVGAQVEKCLGYKWPGEVRAVFTTRAGEVRYVVECTAEAVNGALHIFNGNQLRRARAALKGDT